ncbi:hypothetical protein Syun_020368 [Stephania yunnanensis]|uniref:D-cysteine desulfhydrase n=1 Tax=Stephania yunnanensis TaxID=152371 RepID=A0AAP0IDS8_9MAGN
MGATLLKQQFGFSLVDGANCVGRKLKQEFGSFMPALLDRRWALPTPDTKIHRVALSKLDQKLGEGRSGLSFSIDAQPNMSHESIVNGRGRPSFYVVRDDLLHPLVNGNKARKLDGLLPLLEDHSITDVVTCGGCQSAHAAAVAVSCAERGIRSHLLLRGEQPDIPTGYNLISSMYGNTVYVPRSLYAKREEMLRQNADLVASSTGSVLWLNDILNKPSSMHEYENANYMPVDACGNVHQGEKPKKKVVIVNEGAGGATALLGLIRLVKYLSQVHLLGKVKPIDIVIDSGTGTTAVGLALGAICFGLPWEVSAVMLADTLEGYKQQEKRLISDFMEHYNLHFAHDMLNEADGIVHWVERVHPRKFGNVLKGEVEECQKIARETGILVDPIYTLAAWERAMLLCQRKAEDDANVVMIHTGGTLGMFGLAQRYKSYFHGLEGRAPTSERL